MAGTNCKGIRCSGCGEPLRSCSCAHSTTQPLQVEERHRQQAHEVSLRGMLRLLPEEEEHLALAFAEAEAAVQKWERGFLISCPWCGLATRGEPVSKQIAHLIECGDKREAAVTEAVERRERERYFPVVAALRRIESWTAIDLKENGPGPSGGFQSRLDLVRSALAAAQPREGGQEER